MSPSVLATFFALLSFGASSCAVDPVVLATLPAEEDGGQVACTSNGDCAPYPGTYCETSSCSPTMTGMCVAAPLQTTSDERPVCGCDGITYFNDTLRQAAGVSGRVPGPCIGGLLCQAAGDCPSPALCGRLGRCPHPPNPANDPRGTCWVLPLTPPPHMGLDAWSACEGSAGLLRCADTWTAISTQQAFGRAPLSRMCP